MPHDAPIVRFVSGREALYRHKWLAEWVDAVG
jgi:hypothetical protein